MSVPNRCENGTDLHRQADASIHLVAGARLTLLVPEQQQKNQIECLGWELQRVAVPEMLAAVWTYGCLLHLCFGSHVALCHL